jgi:glycosyltransferase involved in cell wall biosynthesis
MPDLKKKKILWVVYDFYQAGGQRYVYEICKALNKEKFEIDFLKIAPVAHDKNWDTEYYYQPTLDLGCKIFLSEEMIKQGTTNETGINRMWTRTKKVLKKISSGVDAPSADTKEEAIQAFLLGYDHINFSGLNVYKTLCIANNIEPKNGFIHLLTAKFQDKKDIYEGLDKSYNYNFISSFTDDILKFELAGFDHYKHTYYPLCFETIPYEVPKIEKRDQPFIIAIFTRLSNMKPLDPYFFAIKLLSEKGVNVELHIYGAGDPEELGLIRQLKYLYIADKVKFTGHVESIPDKLKTAYIDLIWFQANNQLPAGYAALEITMSGLPQIFWDFSDLGLNNQVGEIFPSFTSLIAFVEFSEDLLNSGDLRNKLGIMQRSYVQEHNSSKTHIHILAELFH